MSPREILDCFSSEDTVKMMKQAEELRQTLQFQLWWLKVKRTDFGKSFNGAHRTYEYEQMTEKINALELLVNSLM